MIRDGDSEWKDGDLVIRGENWQSVGSAYLTEGTARVREGLRGRTEQIPPGIRLQI